MLLFTVSSVVRVPETERCIPKCIVRLTFGMSFPSNCRVPVSWSSSLCMTTLFSGCILYRRWWLNPPAAETTTCASARSLLATNISPAQVDTAHAMFRTLAPMPESLIKCRAGSTYILYKSALRTPPWRTPCSIWKRSETTSPHFMALSAPVCRLSIKFQCLSSTPQL